MLSLNEALTHPGRRQFVKMVDSEPLPKAKPFVVSHSRRLRQPDNHFPRSRAHAAVSTLHHIGSPFHANPRSSNWLPTVPVADRESPFATPPFREEVSASIFRWQCSFAPISLKPTPFRFCRTLSPCLPDFTLQDIESIFSRRFL
jgi:hypothetical protein